jgi:hypothetical protein
MLEITLLAPQVVPTAIDSVYQHNHVNFIKLENLIYSTIKSKVLAVSKVPKILVQMYQATKAEHIHLRCLRKHWFVGMLCANSFPIKKKTASMQAIGIQQQQPWTYKLQQKILQNTFNQKHAGPDIRMGRTNEEL